MLPIPNLRSPLIRILLISSSAALNPKRTNLVIGDATQSVIHEQRLAVTLP